MSQNSGRQHGFKRNATRMRFVLDLAELGFSTAEISSMGNYSLQTVAYDIKIFKKKGQIPANKQSQNFDFRLFFKFFARLFFQKKRDLYDARLFNALLYGSVIQRLNSFAQSLEFTISRLWNPFAEEDERYKNLYNNIFGLKEYDASGTHKKLDVALIEILEQVNRHLEINSEDEVKELLYANIIDPSRSRIAVGKWERYLIDSCIEEALSILPEREAKIIRMHYGIGWDRPHTFYEIRDVFDLSKERISKLERKAFAAVRKSSKAASFKKIGETVSEIAAQSEAIKVENATLKEENIELRARVNYLSKLEAMEKEKIDVLSRREKALSMFVEQLGISVRAYNCFDRANIRTVRDLVQKTEADLLRIKNFGPRTLKEMRERLQFINKSFEIDLHFGMEL